MSYVKNADQHNAQAICFEPFGTPSVDPRGSGNKSWSELLQGIDKNPNIVKGRVSQPVGFVTQPSIIEENPLTLGHVRSVVSVDQKSNAIFIASQDKAYALHDLVHGKNGEVLIPAEAQGKLDVKIQGPFSRNEVCQKCLRSLDGFVDLKEKADDAKLHISDWKMVQGPDSDWDLVVPEQKKSKPLSDFTAQVSNVTAPLQTQLGRLWKNAW
jgi:hypothetical protein